MTTNNKSTNATVCRSASEPTLALYCRTATHSVHATNSQKEYLLRFAYQTGHTNLAWYIDNGNGGLTLDRPELNRLIADITDGKISAVVVASIDRISRGFNALMEWMCLLDSYGVPCYSVDSGEYDTSIVSQFYTFSQVGKRSE